MDVIVGYSGFVGSNLISQRKYDLIVNSKNVEDAFGTNPDFLTYCGVPSEMFVANSNPEIDYQYVRAAINNIDRIKPKHIILISTTAVYDQPKKNEDSQIDEFMLPPYGHHRLLLERWVASHYKDYTIIRLPAVFGVNLRKNLIYDYIYHIPTYLNDSDYMMLSKKSELISESYSSFITGFYKVNNNVNQTNLKEEFVSVGYDSLQFTDSRSIYQFYPLSRLDRDIEVSLDNSHKVTNLVTPPISANELVSYLNGIEFTNILNKKPMVNDVRTKWYPSNYIMDRDEELNEIKKFVNAVSTHV